MTVDPSAIDDPWSALAFVALLLLVGWSSWRGSRHAKRAADTIAHEARPNSGSSMTDKLDRIDARTERTEAKVDDALGRIEALERQRPWWRRATR